MHTNTITEVATLLFWKILSCCIDTIRQTEQARATNVGITHMAKSRFEIGTSEEKATQLLQKHWDLRPSEALPYIKEAYGHADC